MLAERFSAGVAGFGIVVQKHRAIRAGRVLEQCGHFASVQRGHTRIGIACNEEDGRVLLAFLDPVVWRIRVDVPKLLGILG